MKRMLIALPIFFGLLASTASHAAVYIGAQVGYYEPDTDIVGLNYDNTGAGFFLGVETDVVNTFLLGIELGYDYMGSFSDTDVDINAVSILGKGTYMLGDNLGAYVKGGIVREFIDIGDVSGDSDIGFLGALGLKYKINPNFDIHLQYTHIFGKSLRSIVLNESNDPITYDNFSVGVAFYLGRS